MTKKNDKTRRPRQEDRQSLRSPVGFKRATSLELELEKEGPDPNQPPDTEDMEDDADVEDEDVNDTEEMVDSPENPPEIVDPPHQKVIRKRPHPDDEDTQRPLVETILNQAQVITLDDEIKSGHSSKMKMANSCQNRLSRSQNK